MKALIIIITTLVLSACGGTQESKDKEMVQAAQSQYAASQPIPIYNWSLERHLIIELYNIRNMKAVTHSVWRSDRGMIEGDCASIGFGIPYDTSLTNPLQPAGYRDSSTIEQAEPNGIFASKNTAATWVLCSNSIGSIEPVYVETKVTVYPYSVKVDYKNNRVAKYGKSSVTISTE